MNPIVGSILAAVAGAALTKLWDQRRAKASRRPIPDALVYWHPRGMPAMAISVMNRDELDLSIRAVEIMQPKGAKIGWDPQCLNGLTPPLPRPEGGATFELGDWTVQPGQRTDLPLYFQPPDGWTSGLVRMRLSIARRTANRIKGKWYRIDRELVGDRYFAACDIAEILQGNASLSAKLMGPSFPRDPIE